MVRLESIYKCYGVFCRQYVAHRIGEIVGDYDEKKYLGRAGRIIADARKRGVIEYAFDSRKMYYKFVEKPISPHVDTTPTNPER